MSDCEGLEAIGTSRGQVRAIRATLGCHLRRHLPLAAVLASTCLFASACAPLSDSAPAREVTAAVNTTGPSPGRIYAEAVCASCHAVGAGQSRSPNPKAPTFETIANMPGMTPMALNVALHTSHKTMPNLIVEPSRIEDLSIYLHTLKR